MENRALARLVHALVRDVPPKTRRLPVARKFPRLNFRHKEIADKIGAVPNVHALQANVHARTVPPRTKANQPVHAERPAPAHQASVLVRTAPIRPVTTRANLLASEYLLLSLASEGS